MKNTVKKQLFKTISNFETGETSDNRLKHLVQFTKKLEKPHTGPFFGLSSPKTPKDGCCLNFVSCKKSHGHFWTKSLKTGVFLKEFYFVNFKPICWENPKNHKNHFYAKKLNNSENFFSIRLENKIFPQNKPFRSILRKLLKFKKNKKTP